MGKYFLMNFDEETGGLTYYNGFRNLKLTPSEIKELIPRLMKFCELHTDDEIKRENHIIELGLEKELFGYDKHKSKKQQRQRNRSGYVYIFECEGKYKVGFSVDVDKRKQQLDTRPFNLSQVYKKFFKNAYAVEQVIHKKLCECGYDVENEWYELDNDDLQWLIDALENNSEDVLAYVE